MRFGARGRAPRRGVAAGLLVLSLSGIGAAAMPAAGQAVPCDLLLLDCGVPMPTPTPTPAPHPSADPTDAIPSAIPTVPVDPTPVVVPTPAPGPAAGAATQGPTTQTAEAVVAVPDPNAPAFGNPAAQLGASSMTITGLTSVTVVTVCHADGTTVPVLKIVADDIVLTDAVIDVRSTSGSGLVTSSPRMELQGNVQVYLDSITATLPDGTSITLGPATPLSGGLPPALGRVTLGLVGTSADSIGYSQAHQSVS